MWIMIIMFPSWIIIISPKDGTNTRQGNTNRKPARTHHPFWLDKKMIPFQVFHRYVEVDSSLNHLDQKYDSTVSIGFVNVNLDSLITDLKLQWHHWWAWPVSLQSAHMYTPKLSKLKDFKKKGSSWNILKHLETIQWDSNTAPRPRKQDIFRWTNPWNPRAGRLTATSIFYLPMVGGFPWTWKLPCVYSVYSVYHE